MHDPELGEGGGDARKDSIGTSDKSGIYIVVVVVFFKYCVHVKFPTFNCTVVT